MIRFDKNGKSVTGKVGSTLPEMTVESGNAYRQALIGAGVITPDEKKYGPWDRPLSASSEKSPRVLLPVESAYPNTGFYGFWDRPFMSPETVAKLRAQLIEAGLLVPVNSR